MFTSGMIVNDARNHLLTHATFSLNEHREVSRRDLQGNVERTIQLVVVANDAIALFDGLQIFRRHYR